MHSLVGEGLFILAAVLLLWYFKGNILYALVFFIGYVSHLICDSLNPSGVNWLWPKQNKYGISIISTGSEREVAFQNILALLVAGILAYDVLIDGGTSLWITHSFHQVLKFVSQIR